MMRILSAAVAPNSLGSLPGPSGHKRGTGEIKPSRGGNLSADEGSLRRTNDEEAANDQGSCRRMQHVAISSVLLTSTSTTAALPFQHCYFVQLVLPTASHQEDTNDRGRRPLVVTSCTMYYI